MAGESTLPNGGRKLEHRRSSLVERFSKALTIAPGRRAGDPETVVSLDHRLPDPASSSGRQQARWRLATARHRLVRFAGGRAALEQWHRASAQKGRRLVVSDLHNFSGEDLAVFGFVRGPKRGGYRGDYYELRA